MNHYIDITVLSDAELNQSFLLNAVYSKLHKALHGLGSHVLGISFPSAQKNLGSIIRLHGEQADLEAIQALNALARLSDYCSVSEITPVPSGIKGYRTVYRKQPTMSAAKLRRLVKRSSLTEREEQDYNDAMSLKRLNDPYLELQSSSNGHKHRRYIAFGELQGQSVAGKFDTFGLSKTATVPWF